MLMQVGISPELTQAAYRVGDSTTNIITPMMPFTSLMIPYSLVFLVLWTAFLLVYWQLGLPLGIAAEYSYELPTGG